MAPSTFPRSLRSQDFVPHKGAFVTALCYLCYTSSCPTRPTRAWRRLPSIRKLLTLVRANSAWLISAVVYVAARLEDEGGGAIWEYVGGPVDFWPVLACAFYCNYHRIVSGKKGPLSCPWFAPDLLFLTPLCGMCTPVSASASYVAVFQWEDCRALGGIHRLRGQLAVRVSSNQHSRANNHWGSFAFGGGMVALRRCRETA